MFTFLSVHKVPSSIGNKLIGYRLLNVFHGSSDFPREVALYCCLSLRECPEKEVLSIQTQFSRKSIYVLLMKEE